LISSIWARRPLCLPFPDGFPLSLRSITRRIEPMKAKSVAELFRPQPRIVGEIIACGSAVCVIRSRRKDDAQSGAVSLPFARTKKMSLQKPFIFGSFRHRVLTGRAACHHSQRARGKCAADNKLHDAIRKQTRQTNWRAASRGALFNDESSAARKATFRSRRHIPGTRFAYPAAMNPEAFAFRAKL